MMPVDPNATQAERVLMQVDVRFRPIWDALTESFEADGLLEEYDVIFLDTPPHWAT